MPTELTLSNGGLLKLTEGFPQNYTGPVLRGAEVVAAHTKNIQLIIQELSDEFYSMRLSIGTFMKRESILQQLDLSGLYSFFMLKGNLRKDITSFGKLHLRENEYSCIYSGPTVCRMSFEADKSFCVLHVFFSPQLLEGLSSHFPGLKKILDDGHGSIIAAKKSLQFPAMKDITQHILSCPYDEATMRFYFETKVRELLYEMLEHEYQDKPVQRHFRPWEVAKIHEARDILRETIAEKPMSIRSLSRKVALNEFKLKTGFRQYFNSGIFEWMMEQKMQHARELLLSTDRPIKEICAAIGYPRTTNFITAFKRRFGVTPGSLRRK